MRNISNDIQAMVALSCCRKASCKDSYKPVWKAQDVTWPFSHLTSSTLDYFFIDYSLLKGGLFSSVVRKEKKPPTLQTYKGIFGEETGMILSVCSNAMLAYGLEGEKNLIFLSVFYMICFDSVHKKVHMLKCKDLTFMKGVKGSESSSGM